MIWITFYSESYPHGGEPEFIISVAETQNVLSKFASSKVKFVF